MASNAQIESNIEYWSKKADRARRDLEHAEEQVRHWSAQDPDES